MLKHLFFLIIVNLFIIQTFAQQLPPVFGKEYEGKTFNDSRVRTYLTPQRIVWKNDGNGLLIKDSDILLKKGTGQSTLGGTPKCIMRSTDTDRPAMVLDFGKEIQGGLQVVTDGGGQHSLIRLHVRFGESVTEAMTPLGERGAQSDHATRDFIMEIPWMGVAEIGNSGFRFVYVELADTNVNAHIKEINAIFTYRNIPYLGSFNCNDERLNNIWLTGAYTVHLNMQEYIWDGIKRDRLVWLGDLHPEVMTVNTVFGYNEVIPKSLDFTRDITPLPSYMNGMSAYSLWWIIIQRDWYLYQGNLDYLKQQQTYLTGLLNLLFTKIDADGNENLGGGRFLDWPSSPNAKGVKAGLKALMVIAIDAGKQLCDILGDKNLAAKCAEKAALMRKITPDHNSLKQAAALLALADMLPAEKANNEVISIGGAKDFSTFYGYYMLQAQAKAGAYEEALNNIRQFWGGMLDLGATTFWEDFNLDWTTNAAGIDEIVPDGKKDIHADYGAYCYEKLRHSLCHGWASGPTAWMTEHVLGVKVIEPGCKTLQIEPHLGNLEWVEGTFPTPYGIVKISHKKDNSGKIITKIDTPNEVKIIK